MSYSFPFPPLSTPGNAREEIINQFAPFSRLSLSAETFCNIVDFCEDVTANRHAVQQLKDSCYLLLLTAKQSEERTRTNGDSGNIIVLVNNVLLSVKSRIHRWSLLLELDAIAQRNEIEGEIKYCHICLSDCMGHFQNEIYSWREGFVTNCQLDYRDIVEYLSATRNESDILEQAGSGRGDLVKQVIELMQSILNEGTITDHERSGLSRNLYRLQLHCNEILSGIRKELFTGNLPYSGTQYVDIYRGTYLQCGEVAVKVMRSTSFNEHSLRRFNREVKVWAKIWKVDRGRHIVPFYGHGTDDRPIPFFVSPWQPNGNARSYVQSRDLGAEEYRQMIKNIALGIEVLHSMSPPIVHGDINATNILINSQGQPLLADFGVSQMLQDVNGVPLTQSGGMSHAPRWFAPEVWTDGGKLSSMSDIYSYGMTVLELFTHEKPYADIRHTPQATLLASKGTCPKRPSAAEVIGRGMDDNIWTLLTQCWSLRPEARPKIQAVLDEVSMPKKYQTDTLTDERSFESLR
ncbi:kinase-like protein [Dendrothele bispora CBS 962.96]|uniref:Kinase-like protein n=1 Tax=Dendrothele bispora (strain CBS 962.96) TaxID=1314807 RepID=A0A4S8M7P0_DENBC|nr:kinase-like protein [Dendrothele bispora CBS 962.96]